MYDLKLHGHVLFAHNDRDKSMAYAHCHVPMKSLQATPLQFLFNYIVISKSTINMQLNFNYKLEIWAGHT